VIRYTGRVTAGYNNAVGKSRHDLWKGFVLVLLGNVIKERLITPLYKNSIIYVSPEIQYTFSLLYSLTG
jgi:hypothetical protein